MKSKINERIYSRVFDGSNEQYHAGQREKLEGIVGLFEPCKRVLDIGCGDGWFGKRIKRDFGADVHGVDISDAALKKARSSGLKVKRHDLDGNRLPYPDKHFDAVLCGDIIEHLFHTELFIEEIWRVLRKGGFLVLSVPNIAAYYNRLVLLAGKLPIWIESASETTFLPIKAGGAYNTGHVRAYTKETITKLLEYRGFRIEKVRGVPMVLHHDYVLSKHRRYVGLSNSIEKFFARFPTLASLILVKARKL